MSANIQNYLGRESAWHQAGTVLGRAFTWEEAEKKAEDLYSEHHFTSVFSISLN